MQKFQAQRRFRKNLYSWPSILVLFIIVIIFARAAVNAYKKYSLTESVLADTRREYELLLSRKTLLQKDIDTLSTRRGTEAEIRKNFQVAKPGENIFIILEGASTTPKATSTKPSWWQRFLGRF